MLISGAFALALRLFVQTKGRAISNKAYRAAKIQKK
jgi:hypothetical protein